MKLIKAKKLRFKHLNKQIIVGDKFNGLYGTLSEIRMLSGVYDYDTISVYVYDNQYGCGGYLMDLGPNVEVAVEE